jgi:hypothetical protein
MVTSGSTTSRKSPKSSAAAEDLVQHVDRLRHRALSKPPAGESLGLVHEQQLVVADRCWKK